MQQFIVKILEAGFITHDVKRFVTERPPGYDFIPGQGTDVSVNTPEWKDIKRPFTFTGLKEWNYLEFMIKIYPEHNGVTKQLAMANSDSELIIRDVFGAIQYKEPGVFLAAGTGITPFIAIFRDLKKRKKLSGNKLIYSNKTSADVILKKELIKMFENDFINVITREHVIGFVGKRIDREFLIEKIQNFSQDFYVCGPEDFVSVITTHLKDLGATPESIIIEQ
ncbi:MAG: flavodoxin reductase [Bacteroidetes bacterium]|nr:flavodoxin reductase [Bacteroidota bacterium]